MKNSKSYFYFSNFSRVAISICLTFFVLLSIACGGPDYSKKSGTDDTTESNAPKLTSLERDIKSMRTANFDYIYIFRRKDGGVLNAEDKTYLRNNIPSEINRLYMSDEDKAFITGSNYLFPDENMEILKERFDIEDLSPLKDTEDNKNGATNGNGKNQTDDEKTKETK